MNSPKLLYAQYKLALTTADPLAVDGIKNYVEHLTSVIDKLRAEIETMKIVNEQPCGHPLSAIVTNGTTSYCGSCADDSLRANIAAGVEA